MKSIDDPSTRENSYLSQDSDWITFDETTCTSPDQISIAPGYLEREWTENGRRCRAFTETIYIGGRPETARGVACRNPDGTWTPVG